jgi:hypothetical protein
MKHAAAIYLVLIDDNPESFVAMHFAVLRARRLGADETLASILMFLASCSSDLCNPQRQLRRVARL